MLVVACYDISDPKQLTKVAKRMKDFGVRMQKSLFECELDDEGYSKMKESIKKIVDPAKASLRYYRLCASCQNKIEFLGQVLPGLEDVMVF